MICRCIPSPTALLLTILCLSVAGCGATGETRPDVKRAVTVQNRLPNDEQGKPHFEAEATERGANADIQLMRATAARSRSHCPMGIPVPRRGLEFGATEHIVRAGYELLHSADLKTPYWVCETYTNRSLESNVDRDGLKFSADPDLQLAHAVPDDYKGSSKHKIGSRSFPIDIGHMAPAEAHSSTETLLRDTFYLSNAVPQHRSMNRGQWARLEACARTTGPARGAKWVISGPMIYTEADVTEIEVETIGDNVVIPTHTWKVLVYRSPAGQLKSWAAVIPNDKLPEGSQLNDFAISIDEIEDATGFDFLPDLVADEERQLERTVQPIPCQ